MAYDYSCADWDGLHDHLRDVSLDDIFKLSASAAASEFCEWVQVEIDVYIPHCKYQAKPHSSPWFSAACAAVIVHRNYFFCLYQQNKSSESKVKYRQASNHCEKVLGAAKLAFALKTKESRIIGELQIVFSTKVSAITPLFSGSEVLSSASDKATLFVKNVFNNANLCDSGISLPIFPSRTTLEFQIDGTPCLLIIPFFATFSNLIQHSMFINFGEFFQPPLLFQTPCLLIHVHS